jgi:hypothetical protein
MRFTVTLATLAVILNTPIFAQDSTASDAPTTTITMTVVQATATSTVLRSSDTAVSTSTHTDTTSSSTHTDTTSTSKYTDTTPGDSAVAAISSASTIPQNHMGTALAERCSLVVVAVTGAVAIAFGM